MKTLNTFDAHREKIYLTCIVLVRVGFLWLILLVNQVNSL